MPETDYSHLDKPPIINATPGDVARNVARHNKARRLLDESNQLYATARIISKYDCPSIENALNILAKRLAEESSKLYTTHGTKDIALTPEMKDKL